MDKFNVYETNSDATVIITMFGKQIISMHYQIVPTRIPYLRFRFRRLNGYDGPLPLVGKVPFEEGEFEFAVEETQKRVLDQLDGLLRYCYKYNGETMYFAKGAEVEVWVENAVKKDMLHISLRNAHYLPPHMPKKFDVGYNPKRNGRKEAYIRDIVFGLLHAFCSEYVYYISEV